MQYPELKSKEKRSAGVHLKQHGVLPGNHRQVLQKRTYQRTFCLLKTEAYITGKRDFIVQRIVEGGLMICERWKVQLTFSDIFRLYDSLIPRVTSILRFPPLFKLDMFILEGDHAIHRMYLLKHRIRHEICGRKLRKGGFLHAPDSIEEACRHESIIANRIIESQQTV